MGHGVKACAADWGGGMSDGCTADPNVSWRSEWMAA